VKTLARLPGVVVALVATGAFAVPQQQDDDLGSQPITEPSDADLGVVTEEPIDDAVASEPQRRRRVEGTASPLAPASTAPVAAAASSPTAPRAAKDAPVGTQLLAALHDLDDGDPRAQLARLEAAASLGVTDAAAAADPSLRPLQRLVKARIALASGRLDDADTTAREVLAQLDALATGDARQLRHLREAARFLSAGVVEARARLTLFGAVCGRATGIKRLVRDEADERQVLLESVSQHYLDATRNADRFWARRAAFSTARLYEGVARQAFTAPDFRSVVLPAPFALDVVDTALVVDPLMRDWLGELRRVYGELLTSIDARSPDADLADRARVQAAELGRLEATLGSEKVENPWRAEHHPGLVRIAARAERRNDAGVFTPLEARVALEQMNSAVDGTGVDAAYALAGISQAAPDMLPVGPIVKALTSSDDRLVLAGLLAAERVMRGKNGAEKAAALREPVTAVLAAHKPEGAAFSTLRGSLYGLHERSLQALLAIARTDHAAAEVILIDPRVPAAEQAWIGADLADAAFAARYDTWAWDRNDVVAARAVWGGFVARGKRYAGYLLRPNEGGLVGCVSRRLNE
jgi:hypothetical protein